MTTISKRRIKHIVSKAMVKHLAIKSKEFEPKTLAIPCPSDIVDSAMSSSSAYGKDIVVLNRDGKDKFLSKQFRQEFMDKYAESFDLLNQKIGYDFYILIRDE